MTPQAWQARKSAAAAALLSVTIASLGSAQTVSEARIQELIRAAAQRAGVDAQSGPLPPQAPTAANGVRPTVAMTLDEAIKLALDRNLDIAVQRLNPQTFDFSLAGLRAAYHPTLTSTVSQQSVDQPVDSDDFGRSRGHRHRNCNLGLERRHRAEPPLGRRHRSRSL